VGAVADGARVGGEGHAGGEEEGRGEALAEGLETGELVDGRGVDLTGADLGVDLHQGRRRFGQRRGGLVQPVAEGLGPARVEVEAGGAGMTAVAGEGAGHLVEQLDQVAALGRTCAAAGDAALAAGPQERREAGALADLRGDDAEDAEVGLLAAGDDGLRALLQLHLHLRLQAREFALLDAPALEVHLLQLLAQRDRLVGAVGGEQTEGLVGLEQAAGGVEPRREAEGDVARLRRATQLGRVMQGAQAGLAVRGQGREAVAHQRAVRAPERHHVADGGDRDQAEAVHQEAAVALRQLVLAEHMPQRTPGEEPCDTGAAEVGEQAVLLAEPGVQEGGSFRQGLAGQVVVDHDHLTALGGQLGQRPMRGGAVVDGQDQPGVGGADRGQAAGTEAVAIAQAVGQEDLAVEAQALAQAVQHHRAAGAVDVVVAVDQDLVAGLTCAVERGQGAVEVGQLTWVGQLAQARLEHRPCRLQVLDPALPQQGRGQGPQAQRARHRLGCRARGGAQLPAGQRSDRRESHS
jgi:hypothetical protein